MISRLLLLLLIKKKCGSFLWNSTVTVTPTDSNYVNRSASLKRVRLKSTEADEYEPLHSECMRTRQPPYKIVTVGNDELYHEGVASHWIVLFCKRKRRKIETSLVIVIIMLHVLTYFDSYKLF